MIAALFVADYGPYINREGIDPWTETRDARDARDYEGPHPVIAQSPVKRLSKKENVRTPDQFADILISLVLSGVKHV